MPKKRPAPSLRMLRLEERQLRIRLWEQSTMGSEDEPEQRLFASDAKRQMIPADQPLNQTNENRPMRRAETSAAQADLLRSERARGSTPGNLMSSTRSSSPAVLARSSSCSQEACDRTGRRGVIKPTTAMGQVGIPMRTTRPR
jgi:hypothetical protein